MMGMTAQQIADTLKAGQGPEGLFREGREINDLAKRHSDVVDRIKKLQKRMESSWKGKAADAAYVGAGPLAGAANATSEHMSSASKLYEEQGDSFNTVKSKVGDGPGPKPLDTQAPASLPSSGPQMLDGPGLDKWYEKSRQVVDSYNNYKSESKDNASRWPKDYGKLGLPDGSKDFHVATADGNGDGSKGYVSGPGPGGDTGSGDTSGPGGPGESGTSGGAGNVPGTGDGSTTGTADGSHSASETPAAGDTSTSTSGFTKPGDSAGGSGHPGSTAGPGAGTGHGTGTGSGSGSGHGHGSGIAPGYGSAVGSGNSAGSGARGSAGGSTGGNGPGGTGSRGGAPRSGSATGGGTGSGSGSGTGSGSGGGNAAPGKSSGVGGAREAAGPVRGGAAATGGSPGNSAGGRGMMPGMGGAGRGQGGDETHERPSFLEEPDSDGLFGPDPDDKTVPPVIGL